MSNSTPPTRLAEDQSSYEFVCRADSSLRFSVVNSSGIAARVNALDKIGYTIISEPDRFLLVDADDVDDVVTVLEGKLIEQALAHAFRFIGWVVSGPTHLIGGSLGAGYSDFTGNQPR